MLVGQERPTESSWMSGGASPAQIWAQDSRLGETSKWGLEGASSGWAGPDGEGCVGHGSEFGFYSQWKRETLEGSVCYRCCCLFNVEENGYIKNVHSGFL